MKKKILLAYFLIFCSLWTFAQQQHAEIFGRVTNESGMAIPLANIGIIGDPGGTSTNETGNFTLQVKAIDSVTLFVSCVGYSSYKARIFIRENARLQHNIVLVAVTKTLETFTIEDRSIRATPMEAISVRSAETIPSMLGDGIISVVKSQPGVSSNNELSSQYSVRGGNYDENLVYVNHVEIYRPALVRSGIQEGLPFVNSDLTQNIIFSSGGFAAKYGDKMSSALDIQYKQPKEFAGSLELSLLSAKMHLEGATKNEKFNYLLGVRQKSNQYILKSLPTKGDYKPSFTDIQMNLNWNISQKWKLSGLGYYSRNVFKFQPSVGETNFGTVQDASRLTIYYEGQEITRYDCFLGSVAASFTPHSNLNLQLIGTAYQSIESETFDILGEYYLGKLDADMGSSTFGDALKAEGVGSYLEHARNKMNSIVANVEHLGNYKVGRSFIQWGAKFQYEDIIDNMSEWDLVDSAGFSIPSVPDSVGYQDPSLHPNSLALQNVLKSNDHLTSDRISGFLQNTWTWDEIGIDFTAGARIQYWTVNKQLTFSPRANLAYRPQHWKPDMVFRFSTGVYHQPPFFKELKDLQGNINRNVKAQEAIHFVLGFDWNFLAKQQPLKFVAEAYYKYLDNIIPYVIDNLNIRYIGNNMARGYTTGIDLKLGGELVPGTDSWITLSLMSTEQKIVKNYEVDGQEVVTGYMPRPTDQRLNMNLFFEDYIPRAPTWKVYLNMIFGTGLPVYAPNTTIDRGMVFRMPGYKRVDVGFSKLLLGEGTKFSEKHPSKVFKSLWLSLEIFNLFQFSNVISYTWVQDVSGITYAIPNYMTPLQVNARIAWKF